MYDRELDDIANRPGQCPDCWRSGEERTGCNCLTESTDSVPHKVIE